MITAQNVRITFDTRRFDAAARRYIATTNRDLADIVNQRALNVAGRALDHLKPSDVVMKRKEIHRYMWQPYSTRVRQLASGKRKGQFTQRGTKGNQLARVHLIVQARRAKAGLKGLYGHAMRKAAGKLASHAQNSVGFLKSLFLPIIVTLNPLCRFKFPFAKTENISRWPGSAGYGRVRAAKPGGKPAVTLHLGAALRRTDQEPKVQRIVAGALQWALNQEAREMERHVTAKLQEAARREGIVYG